MFRVTPIETTRFYLEWDRVSRDLDATQRWLEEWVYEIPNRAAYLEKLGSRRIASLVPAQAIAAPIDYGDYSDA